MSEIRLLVNGRSYGGWRSVSVSRSIDGQSVIDGYVDRRTLSVNATSRTLSYEGRDRTAAIVDCSALLDGWSFRGASVAELARKVCDPYGIRVSLSGVSESDLRISEKLTINPGEKGYQVLGRAAKIAGVLLVSDGAGSMVITRSGSSRAASLVEGENLLEFGIEYNAINRFRTYVVAAQGPGTDNSYGAALRVRGEATDEGVKRSDRVLVLRPSTGMNREAAKRRADWEARTRAAQSETFSATVRGWQQSAGSLWSPNSLSHVQAPSAGVNGDMLIARVEHTIDEGGELSRLSLVRPDAFTPEPRAVVRKSGGAWKEIAGGV